MFVLEIALLPEHCAIAEAANGKSANKEHMRWAMGGQIQSNPMSINV
jgi:hypothetical protein